MADSKPFADTIVEVIVQDDATRPMRVAIMEKDDRLWLEIRAMHRSKNGLRHGKGVWISLDDDMAEEVLMAAQQVLLSLDLEEVES